MKKALLVAGLVGLFAGVNALVFGSRDYSSGDDLLIIVLLVGIGIAFGLMAGRWWALALPLAWIPLSLVWHDPQGEITLVAGVVLTLLIVAPIQAAGIGLGVLTRRLLEPRMR